MVVSVQRPAEQPVVRSFSLIGTGQWATTARLVPDPMGKTMPDVTLAFVHGLFSGPSTWDNFTRLIDSDPELRDVVAVKKFSYSTPYLRLSPLRRIPLLGDIASSFGGWLRDDLGGQRVIIVSHSMGGLVVQRYFADMVRASRAGGLAIFPQSLCLHAQILARRFST